MKIDLTSALAELGDSEVEWKKTAREGLDLDYAILFPKSVADEIMSQLENSLEYYDGASAKVKVFGKWHDIPRQQVAYGSNGLQYRFSGITVTAKPWIQPLEAIRDLLSKLVGHNYNFVLINRYRNGSDHIGEHRDDESELDSSAPIASLSFGQQRQFLLKHGDCRKKGSEKRNIPLVKMDLQHGSVLLMNPPTNRVWYHSLPVRKSAHGIRINLTFRKIVQ